MLKQKEISCGRHAAALGLAALVSVSIGAVDAAQANSLFQNSLEGVVIAPLGERLPKGAILHVAVHASDRPIATVCPFHATLTHNAPSAKFVLTSIDPAPADIVEVWVEQDGAVIMQGAADIADSPLLVFIAPSDPLKDQ
jgi:hypothetical protein